MVQRSLINFQVRMSKIIPPWMLNVLYGLRLLPSYIHWLFNPSGSKNTFNKLASLKNKYTGYRCVVVGNGPSLRTMDLSLLEDEYTFGLNRIYLMFNELGFSTSFLVAVNRFVLQQFNHELYRADSFKILNWRYRDRGIELDDQTVFLPPSPFSNKMNGKIIRGYYPHIGSVTNVALEIAFYLGFSEVILIGVDHNYVEKGLGSKAIVSQSSDVNHFSSDYFGKGTIWQLPDYVLMEKGFRENRKLFNRHDRQIVDATVDGKLDVFTKVELMDYLKESKFKNKSDL